MLILLEKVKERKRKKREKERGRERRIMGGEKDQEQGQNKEILL